ncbi:MAG: sodium:proton antiporter [Desulfohalobiaceae bacterium]
MGSFLPGSFPIFGVTAILLFCLGLHGLFTRRHLLRKIMGMNIMAGGVFLLLISVAQRSGSQLADPVPQAMVLTGIVISISATGFALALMRRIQHKTGRAHLVEPDADEGDL